MRRFSLLLVCALVSCSRFKPVPSSAPTFSANMGVFRMLNEERPPCLAMVKTFCSNLYSPGNQGKMEIQTENETLQIKRGRTENDFSQAYFEFAHTQIRHRERLPKSFREILAQRGYFKKLKTYLSRRPAAKMSFEERVSTLRLSNDIDAIWNGAINETVFQRMEKNHPGFAKISEDFLPVELKHERRRMRAKLISEISSAVWADHPNWKKVEAQFREVKEAYKDVISRHPGLRKQTKKDWLKRIAAVRLIVPGSDPEVEMIACSNTEENAYYYTYRNYVTVCAGDFNAEDMRQTLAHELAHALDVNRMIAVYQAHSAFGKQLAQMKQQTCSHKNISCKDWDHFKNRFGVNLQSLAHFKTPMPDFNRCLKGKETKFPIPEEYLARIGKEEAQEVASELAEQNVFLRLITEKLPLPDGSFHKNPMHLNPCGYYLWDHESHLFDEELTVLLFFTQQYVCHAEHPPEQRFQKAIDTAIELQRRLVVQRLKLEGEYSSRWRLNADGYAVSTTERFADTLASLALTRILEKEKNISKRRALYLANISWLCQKPSIKQLYPNEARIQHRLRWGQHSDDSYRQTELLQGKIPEVLQCQRDFGSNVKECRLEEYGS
ncbi:MAG: hypothetical protein HY537_17170 [Deltaproteobacteria bacterium]|nr:hypothetical protein [Deltaproteobacteria bacterium]